MHFFSNVPFLPYLFSCFVLQHSSIGLDFMCGKSSLGRGTFEAETSPKMRVMNQQRTFFSSPPSLTFLSPSLLSHHKPELFSQLRSLHLKPSINSIRPFHSTRFIMVSNNTLLYAQLPEGEVVPGTHLKKTTPELDIDSVSLDGGFLLKSRALSLDPYLRGRMRKVSFSPRPLLLYCSKLTNSLVNRKRRRVTTRQCKLESLSRLLVSERSFVQTTLMSSKFYLSLRSSQAPRLSERTPLLEEKLVLPSIVRDNSDTCSYRVGSIWRGLVQASDYSVVSGDALKKGKCIKNDEDLPWTNLVGAVGMPSASESLFPNFDDGNGLIFVCTS